MNLSREWKPLAILLVGFLICYFLPVGTDRFDHAVQEALYLVQWYARNHVVLCLVPAFFIAGAISVFISQNTVLKYLGPQANKFIAYGVASISGTILAVCSCTILPLFAGIYNMGAGLGPATAFLYAGPAINVLAIILSARILGFELGLARAIGAILFSIVIGLLMHVIFMKDEQKEDRNITLPSEGTLRPLWQTALHFAVMVGILVFANWGRPAQPTGIWASIYANKWLITAILALFFAVFLIRWFSLPWWKVTVAALPPLILGILHIGTPLLVFTAGIICLSILLARREDENGQWFMESWHFAKQILPLLLMGVLLAGLLLGRPGNEGLIPAVWVAKAVGGNSLQANFVASFAGAFMYFATLTEVPILQGLLGNGMGKGPALALLLAGPALSLPNMLVIRSIIGTKKTIVFVALVICMATVSGLVYGAFF